MLHILRELLQCNYWEQADRWLTERYLQHNPNVESGRDNVVAYFSGLPRTPTCDKLTMPIVTVLTSGDIVGVVFRMQYDDPRKPGAEVHLDLVRPVAHRRRPSRRALGHGDVGTDRHGAVGRASSVALGIRFGLLHALHDLRGDHTAIGMLEQ